MGTGFSYRYDDTYKSPRELVHLLLDVVAKGGNLALNVAPGPDGRLPEPAIERMEALGAWLRANGKGVYATRPAAPFAEGDWRFTGSKDCKTTFAFRLWKDGERDLLAQTIPAAAPEKVARIVHLGTSLEVPFKVTSNGLAIRLPETFRTDPYADCFALHASP
jgi:alpha-L-fucosidase